MSGYSYRNIAENIPTEHRDWLLTHKHMIESYFLPVYFIPEGQYVMPNGYVYTYMSVAFGQYDEYIETCLRESLIASGIPFSEIKTDGNHTGLKASILTEILPAGEIYADMVISDNFVDYIYAKWVETDPMYRYGLKEAIQKSVIGNDWTIMDMLLDNSKLYWDVPGATQNRTQWDLIRMMNIGYIVTDESLLDKYIQKEDLSPSSYLERANRLLDKGVHEYGVVFQSVKLDLPQIVNDKTVTFKNIMIITNDGETSTTYSGAEAVGMLLDELRYSEISPAQQLLDKAPTEIVFGMYNSAKDVTLEAYNPDWGWYQEYDGYKWYELRANTLDEFKTMCIDLLNQVLPWGTTVFNFDVEVSENQNTYGGYLNTSRAEFIDRICDTGIFISKLMDRPLYSFGRTYIAMDIASEKWESQDGRYYRPLARESF